MMFGPIDRYEEAILLPSGLAEAAEILRDSCGTIPQEDQDVCCGSQAKPKEAEYRMIIDVQEVKKGLAALASFFEDAARKQRGVQLWF